MEGEKSRNPAAGAICVLPEIKPSGNPAVSISITQNIPLSAVPEAQIFMSAEPAVCVQKKRICRQKADRTGLMGPDTKFTHLSSTSFAFCRRFSVLFSASPKIYDKRRYRANTPGQKCYVTEERNGGNQATNYAKSNNLASEGNSEYNAAVQNLSFDENLWNEISDMQPEFVFAQENGDEAEIRRSKSQPCRCESARVWICSSLIFVCSSLLQMKKR